MIRWLRRTAPWQGSFAADMQHAIAVEETQANVRVVIVAVSLAVAWLERWRPNWNTVAALLAAFAIFSLVAQWAVRARRIRTPGHVVLVHAIDTATILLILLLSGGALSPFSTLFLFVLLAAGYRWGQLETWLTCAAGIVMLGAHAALATTWHWAPEPDTHIVAMRLTYLAVGGALVGYMAESERVHRHRARSVSTILSRVRAEGGLVAAVRAVLDELLGQFGAGHAVLVLEEEGHDVVWLWQAEKAGGEPRRATIRLAQERRGASSPIFLFPVPPGADAWKVTRTAAPGGDVLAVDADGRRIHRAFSAAPLFGTPFPWRAALCLSSIAGDGWKGRLYLFLPFTPRAGRQQLRYLQVVVRQVGPALFNLYLQRRLHSRAGVVDRARISRELHDGVIQSLIGTEMQLEVLRREAAGKIPEATAAQLTNVQRLLSQEILDVRDLMLLLKPAEVDAKRLVEHLADTLERFRHRTGIQTRLACDEDEIDLSPRVCREVAGMVQEALANIRKHSSATSVLVRLGRCNGQWQLVIDDNGKGLDFEGYLTHEELEAQRKGPMVIKERVRAIGGRLGIHSQPGFGTRLEITIPRKHNA